MDRSTTSSKGPRGLAARLRSRAGYGVPILLVAVGIVVLAAGAAAAFAMKIRSDLRKQTAFSGRDAFVAKIKGHVLNEQGWATTLAAPANAAAFACLNAGAGASCCGVSDMPFGIVDQSGAMVYDSRAGAGVGFTYGGQPCASYDDALGDENCPLRAEVTWSGINPGFDAAAGLPGIDPLCRSVQIKINVKHKNPKNTVPFNSSNLAAYDGLFMREREEGYLVSHCTALGGTFNPITSECRLRLANGPTCPPGQFLKGIDAAGNAICGVVSSLVNGVGLCPSGAAIRTLALSGDTAAPDCQLYPKMPPCEPDHHVEGNYCYYDYKGPCSLPGGAGRFKWNGAGAYPCTAETCSANHHLYNGGCYLIQTIAPHTIGIFVPGGQVPLACTDASFIINGSVCSCPAGQHVEGGVCQNDSRGCGSDCGGGVWIPGVQYWAGAGWDSVCHPTGTCPAPTPQGCNAGQHMEGGGCVADIRSCTNYCPYDAMTYSGQQIWNGSGWEPCDAVAVCNSAYWAGPE